MAGLLVTVSSGDVTMVAATAKTVLQIKAPANQRLLVSNIAVFGEQPAGGTDPTMKIILSRSSANFGSATGSATATKMDAAAGETIQGTYGYNFTVEPTSPVSIGREYILNPQTGFIEPWDPANPIQVPGGYALNITITTGAASTPAVVVNAIVQE